MRKLQLDFQPAGSAGFPLRVDRELGVIYGAQVMRTGEVRGHDCYADIETLQALVAAGNSNSSVKARWEHPSMCSPTLGTYLGRQKNFRLDGDVVRADLHLYEKADPEKRKHVMDMAEDNPDMIGQSVCIYCSLDPGTDERFKIDGEQLPVVRVKSLTAVDVVDQGAATDGMFAEQVPDVELSARTFAELRQALERPGFLDRALQFLNLRQDDSAVFNQVDEDEVGEPEELAMSVLTLDDFKAKHPEVAKAFADELLAGQSEAKVASEERGRDEERARIQKVLQRSKPHHFTSTKQYPNGFVFHVLSEGLSYEAALEGLMDLDAKHATLVAFEEASADIPVESAGAPEKQLSAKEVAQRNLMDAVSRVKGQKGGE